MKIIKVFYISRVIKCVLYSDLRYSLLLCLILYTRKNLEDSAKLSARSTKTFFGLVLGT